MSYILDALKKSEKERRRGALPDMLTVQDIVADKPSKRLHYAYLLGAVLLLNTGVLVWWLGFSHTNKTNAVQTSATDNILPMSVNGSPQAVPERVKPGPGPAQSTSPESRPAERATVPIESNESRTSAVKQYAPKALAEVQAHTASTGNIVKPSEPGPLKPEHAVATGRLSNGPAGGLSEVPDENKLYKLQELPSAIFQGLPAFSVSALLYSSNPASRMVRINEHMMHEGQDMTEGIKLEEITRDGVILRYQKYRFYVAVK